MSNTPQSEMVNDGTFSESVEYTLQSAHSGLQQVQQKIEDDHLNIRLEAERAHENKADKDVLQALENKVSSIEATLEDTRSDLRTAMVKMDKLLDALTLHFTKLDADTTAQNVAVTSSQLDTDFKNDFDSNLNS